MQAVCLLFSAQLHLAEGGRAAAAEGLAAAEAVIAALPEQRSTAVSQLRLHALALTTLRQLAAGETGDILRSGARKSGSPLSLAMVAERWMRSILRHVWLRILEQLPPALAKPAVNV